MTRSDSRKSPPGAKISLLPQNLRAKLTLGTLLIVMLSLAGAITFVYLRGVAVNSMFTSQLEQIVRREAEEKLTATGAEQAAALNEFFISAGEDISKIDDATQNLLASEGPLNTGAYWNASLSLSRIQNGSWDNENREPSSVFIPARFQLTDPLASELNAIKHIDFSIPSFLAGNPDILAIYFGGVSGETVYFPNIDLAAILPPDFDVTQRPWFTAAAPGQNPQADVVWSAPYLDAALNGIIITGSAPVIDSTGRFRGVIGMDIHLNRIAEPLAALQIAESGYTLLVDKENRLIALSPAGFNDLGSSPELLALGETIEPARLPNAPAGLFDILNRTSAGEKGLSTLTISGVERLAVYQPIPEVGYSLLLIVPTHEILAAAAAIQQQVSNESRNTLALSILLAAAALAAAVIAVHLMGNILTNPLKSLNATVEQIAAGDLSAQAVIQSDDEVGGLARSLNAMTSAVRGLIQSLEQRVDQRASELALANQGSQRRAAQLEAISLVARTIASIQNLDELLPRVTQLVSEDFGFYHVGIFMLDESRRFAVLRSANSEGGQKMLERNHRLEIGQTGIVGFVADQGQARIALDVGADPVFFNNPDLPATRSEMALPLRLRGEIIGVLDVQSTEPGAFTEEDSRTLSVMADQIAIAIENARLFGESRQSLVEIQALYSQYLNQEWAGLIKKGISIGYLRSFVDGKSLDTPIETEEIRHVLNTGMQLIQNPEDPNEDGSVVMPIKLRGQVIGVLNIKRPSVGHDWREEEVNMIHVISDRLALALENARLFEETTRTAEREKLVSDITTSFRSTNDPQAMIELAVSELRRALGVSRVEIIPQRVSSSET